MEPGTNDLVEWRRSLRAKALQFFDTADLLALAKEYGPNLVTERSKPDLIRLLVSYWSDELGEKMIERIRGYIGL
jgi:hypothetical protein